MLPGLLYIGHDHALLQSRKGLLGAHFHVETASDIAEAAARLVQHDFLLVILCSSVTPRECGIITQMMRNHCPPTKVLAIHSGIPGHGIFRLDQEFVPEDGPAALVEKALQMAVPRGESPDEAAYANALPRGAVAEFPAAGLRSMSLLRQQSKLFHAK